MSKISELTEQLRSTRLESKLEAETLKRSLPRPALAVVAPPSSEAPSGSSRVLMGEVEVQNQFYILGAVSASAQELYEQVLKPANKRKVAAVKEQCRLRGLHILERNPEKRAALELEIAAQDPVIAEQDAIIAKFKKDIEGLDEVRKNTFGAKPGELSLSPALGVAK